MRYQCNGNDLYLMSIFPVSKDFNVKYLFLQEASSKINVNDKITILLNEQNGNDIIKEQLTRNNIKFKTFNYSNLSQVNLSISTPYTLILNAPDAVILKDLDDAFISKFKELNIPNGFLCSATNLPIAGINLEEGFELFVPTDFKYCSTSIMFGDSSGIQKYLDYILNLAKDDKSSLIACENNYDKFFEIQTRLSIGFNKFNYDYNTKLFTILDYFSMSVRRVDKDITKVVSNSPYLKSGKLL